MLDDLMRSLKGAYFKSPDFIRMVLGSLYQKLPGKIRFGKEFYHFQNLITNTEYLPINAHLQHQWHNISKSLDVAFGGISYYQNVYRQHGIKRSDVDDFASFRKLPFLTKQNVKEHLEEMTAKAIPRWKWLETTTGGSTLNPMRFYQVRGLTRSKERAFIQDQWGRFGYKPGARAVQLKGRNVGHPSRRIFWEYEPIQNFLEMNSQFLTEENLPSYVEAIIRFKPEFLIGYVSSIFLLARYLESHPQCRFPRLRGLFLASENVYPWQRTLFSRVFNCPICAHYGHSEMVLLGAACPLSARYHFYPQYGYLEVIGPDGKPCDRPGQVGELVGTSFDNPLMPFIRYRTQDYGIVGEPACPCGRHYPVIERIEGRLQEFIVTRSGRLISVCVMGAAHFDVLDNVHQTQYFQDTPGRVIFRVVPKSGFSLTDLNRIQAVVQAKTGNDVQVEVQVVKEIPRTESGKHRMIIQKLDIPLFPDTAAGSGPADKE